MDDLARFKSKASTGIPDGATRLTWGNPASGFWEALEDGHVADCLPNNDGVTMEDYGMRLHMWGGPLEGILHQEGQFGALHEDSEATLPDEEAQLLVQDLELLSSVSHHAQAVVYSSESDYGMAPVIFEVPEGTDPDVDLSAEQVLGAMGISPAMSHAFTHRPVAFGSAEHWVGHMMEHHINRDLEDEDEPDWCKASRAGFEAAVRTLAPKLRYPLFEVVMELHASFNPIPFMWVGRSATNPNVILGLVTAVVWT